MNASNRLRGLVTGAALLASASVVQADMIDTWLNGFYYENGTGSRRGLGVHYIPTGLERGSLFIAFYTFDDATGEPMWVTGNATVHAGQFSVEIPLSRVAGGTFGDDDIGTPVPEANWATGTITVNSCDSIGFSWTSPNVDAGSIQNTWFGNVAGSANSQCVYREEFAGCPDFATEGADERTCIIPGGEYTEDMTLTNDATWFLGGAVYIGERDNPDNTNTLTIEPGTRIVGGDGNTLLGIQRGAKIMAHGLPHAPIVMTGPCPASLVDEDLGCPDGGQPAQWGGMTINGRAPLNTCNTPGACTSEGEGESGEYGGGDPHDDSGVLKYVRVQFAGFLFNDTNELNGIAFQGVGDGTVVENIQVHANEDDGVEFFGGTVNARNIVITNAKDDSLDWTEGWQGRIQNLLVVQNQDFGLVDAADQGIEADNLEGNNDNTPRAQPKIANATFIGRPDDKVGVLRRGTGANISNAIFTGFGIGLDIDDAATFTAAGTPAALTGVLTMQNTILDNTANFTEDGGDPYTVQAWFEAQDGNSTGGSNLDGVFPPAGAAYLSGYPLDTGVFDAFFQNYGYIGAFSGRNGDWTAGWTLQDFANE